MVYNYVNHVRRQMHHELSFCKGSAKDISVEVYHMKSVADQPLNRTARQAGYGADVNPAPSCDGCPCQDSQDHKEPQGNPDSPANQEHLVHQATPESHRPVPASLPLHHLANHAHKDHPDLPDLQEAPATQEKQEPQAGPAQMHLPAAPAPEDPPDHQEKPALWALLENPASPLNPSHSPPESPASQATLDLQDLQDLPDLLVPMALLAHPDQRERTDPMELLVRMDSPDPLDLPEVPVPPERKVFAPSTAPSTVACSSRMERDVKRRSDGNDLENSQRNAVFSPLPLLLLFLYVQPTQVNDNR